MNISLLRDYQQMGKRNEDGVDLYIFSRKIQPFHQVLYKSIQNQSHNFGDYHSSISPLFLNRCLYKHRETLKLLKLPNKHAVHVATI